MVQNYRLLFTHPSRVLIEIHFNQGRRLHNSSFVTQQAIVKSPRLLLIQRLPLRYHPSLAFDLSFDWKIEVVSNVFSSVLISALFTYFQIKVQIIDWVVSYWFKISSCIISLCFLKLLWGLSWLFFRSGPMSQLKDYWFGSNN